jgi:predicted nucleic acid-binding protein
MGILKQEIPLVLSAPIVLEYLDVLQRSNVLRLTGLNHEQSADLVTDLIALSQEVQIHFAWRPNLVDAGDNKFVEAAIYAGATIITYNQRDFAAADLPPYGWSWATPQEFLSRYGLEK